MSISATTPSPGGGFDRNKNDKENMITRTNTVIPHAPKSIEELNLVCTDLIKGYQEDIANHRHKSSFWLSKAKESIDSFNDSLNDYLVKKNERNLVNVDYDCIYVYYRACKLILEDVIPLLPDFREIQEPFSELMNEVLNNDMYFAEIKKAIELRHAPAADILLARFNNLKRSFSSSVTPEISSYTLLQSSHKNPQSFASSNSLNTTPRSSSPVSLITHENNNVHIDDFIAEVETPSRSLTPVPDISHTIVPLSPKINAVAKIKSPPPVPAHLKSRSLSPVKIAVASDGFFTRFSGRSVISPSELNDLVEKFPTSILVIDYRSTNEFDNRHIYFPNSSNVIHIDPLAVRDDYNTADIESSSMLTNSDHEKKLFKDRLLFELVVIYDQNSLNIESNTKLQMLNNILCFKNTDKPLIRNPVLLSGGLDSWIKLYGASGIASNLGIIREDLSIEFRNHNLARPLAIPSRQSGNVSYYKNENSSYSSTSLDSFEKSNYNRSQTDFFASQFKKKVVPRTVSPPTNIGPAALLKPSIDVERPQSALHLARRTSSSTSESLTLDAQKRQLQINEFDKNLTIITGVANLGNTCYMNCILQCLVGTKGLTRFFLMNDYENKINFKSRLGSKGVISKAFHGVVSDMFSRSVVDQKRCYSISPQRFKQTIGALNADFRGFQQQDCFEFLNFLLDSLHEDLNQRGDSPKFPPLTPEEEAHREKMSIRLASSIEWEKYLKTDFSSIVDIFQGQYLSRLQCTVCKTTSTTYNPFSTLSIPIPEHVKGPVTLEQCFEEFCKTEILDGDERWLCPHCKKKQRSTKTLRISILPKNLIIHLKRFKISHVVTKLNTFVKYPSNVSLLKYWPQDESDSDKFKMKNFPDRGQKPPFDYQLYGVVNHFGSLRSGHYTSFVDKSDTTRNGWCYFDDTSVTKNCDISKVINENAYVLFYRRI